jgi:hypothetical protein
MCFNFSWMRLMILLSTHCRLLGLRFWYFPFSSFDFLHHRRRWCQQVEYSTEVCDYLIWYYFNYQLLIYFLVFKTALQSSHIDQGIVFLCYWRAILFLCLLQLTYFRVILSLILFHYSGPKLIDDKSVCYQFPFEIFNFVVLCEVWVIEIHRPNIQGDSFTWILHSERR